MGTVVVIVAVGLLGLSMAGCLNAEDDRRDEQNHQGVRERGSMAVFVKDQPEERITSLKVTFGGVRAVTEATVSGSESGGAPTVTPAGGAGQDGDLATQAPPTDEGQGVPSPGEDAVTSTNHTNLPIEGTPTPGTATPTSGTGEGGERMSSEDREVMRTSSEIDLASLAGPREAELLGAGALQPGAYDHLIIEIERAEATFGNASEPQELALASKFLVVTADFEIVEDQTIQILVDFDLNGSVIREGATDRAGNATDGNGTEGPTAGGDGLAFHPVVQGVWTAVTEGREVPRDDSFAFDEAEEADAATFAAASAELRGGVLVVTDVSAMRSGQVETSLRVDVDGDGVPDLDVDRGDLENEIDRVQTEDPGLTDGILQQESGVGGSLRGGTTGGTSTVEGDASTRPLG